ncbi:MAG: hypothetical protein AAB474_02650 [Patescibacteria group bacterium]
MKKYYKIITGSVGLLFPALTVLAATPNTDTFAELTNYIKGLVDAAVLPLVVIAGLIFLYGAATFVFNAADEEKRTEGKSIIMYSLIGIILILSVWGIINIFAGLRFGTTNLPTVK